MKLHQATFLNRLAKKAAHPLSRVACSRLLSRPMRVLDAYANFLMGKGSGAGWDIDHEVEAATSRVYRDHPIVFDVGANLGTWSERFLRTSVGARVFMFEPAPDCQRQIRLRNLPGATLIPKAVGEHRGKAALHSSSATDGSASLYQRGESYFNDRQYQPHEVEVCTLDDVIEEYQLDFVDFLKMDIEGHELFALKGAERSLSAKKIGALSFEFGSGNVNSRTFFRDFWTLLNAHDFLVWRITPGGKLSPVDEYYEDCEYFRGVSNYLAELRNHPKRPVAG